MISYLFTLSYRSNELSVKTHALDNLTGINVCFGQFAHGAEGESELDQSVQILNRIGAVYSEELSSDTTHLVCQIAQGAKYEKAVVKTNNTKEVVLLNFEIRN